MLCLLSFGMLIKIEREGLLKEVVVYNFSCFQFFYQVYKITRLYKKQALSSRLIEYNLCSRVYAKHKANLKPPKTQNLCKPYAILLSRYYTAIYRRYTIVSHCIALTIYSYMYLFIYRSYGVLSTMISQLSCIVITMHCCYNVSSLRCIVVTMFRCYVVLPLRCIVVTMCRRYEGITVPI